MDSPIFIFEHFFWFSRVQIIRFLWQHKRVYVLEAFSAYHKRRYFFSVVPDYVSTYRQSGTVQTLSLAEGEFQRIYRVAGDTAVEQVERVFPFYRKKISAIVDHLDHALGTSSAETVFKKYLCERLAEFYSANILLNKLSERFAGKHIVFYPDFNIPQYLFLKKLIVAAGVQLVEHPSIHFSISAYLAGVFDNTIRGGKRTVLIIGHCITSTLVSFPLWVYQTIIHQPKKRMYKYGVAIIGAHQLRKNRRGPDFIIDGSLIFPHEVVYLPLARIPRSEVAKLKNISGAVHEYSRRQTLFSRPLQWLLLLCVGGRGFFLHHSREWGIAWRALYHYFLWQDIAQEIQIKHFITHSDFGINHIPRNIALSQAGISTWYYTDSMYIGGNLLGTVPDCRMRHPYWTYLSYDHFVTWDDFIAEFYAQHPSQLKSVHVVGCLWSANIQEKNNSGASLPKIAYFRDQKYFVITAFDSTYAPHGTPSYREGFAFAQHLLQLVKSYPEVAVIIKEKKSRGSEKTFDPVLGKKLLECYERLSAHPRITVYPSSVDGAQLISTSDLVLSIAFTSPTFEALSVNRPAIWHDPMGYYRDTPYATIAGLTTHGLGELEARVRDFLAPKDREYRNPLSIDSPLSDPYRDGKAIERFRALLHRPL
ncbi:polysaccharide biosynthesis PFTS motif protein [Candidatus Uhrbacteria bacterium]|nr:polysaccharide biosynthesis PFTS motif protein [Candidatus Uhrbacteria bacterium]